MGLDFGAIYDTSTAWNGRRKGMLTVRLSGAGPVYHQPASASTYGESRAGPGSELTWCYNMARFLSPKTGVGQAFEGRSWLVSEGPGGQALTGTKILLRNT
ncbi:uncharacterized protein METZ01_LOCUS71157 [marine metagenome]|uniref:Uncharacterized protein n=1 Tax=marine metagenome TaxID=408172 RepID=A0A381TW28_9ZZZZ